MGQLSANLPSPFHECQWRPSGGRDGAQVSAARPKTQAPWLLESSWIAENALVSSPSPKHQGVCGGPGLS